MVDLTTQVIQQIGTLVLGKSKEIHLALACLLAKGHLLIEDLPGMGKTTLAQSLSKSLGLSYQRTQFTSDMLPADILGVSIFNRELQQFEIHKGPIFSQVVLADEINRASPKTQSALLESMENGEVSIDGKTYDLPVPFFVIATQNPLFHAGTYPLPESQLDRFMMRLSIGFPSFEAERQMLEMTDHQILLKSLVAKITPEQLMTLQHQVSNVHTAPAVIEYIISLCTVSRGHDFQGHPLSPRAGKALLACAKAWAFLLQRDHVLPDDVMTVFPFVCEHRLDGGQHQQGGQKHPLSASILAQVNPIMPR